MTQLILQCNAYNECDLFVNEFENMYCIFCLSFCVRMKAPVVLVTET